MIIHENIPIKELTTMRLGGNARYVIEIESANDIPEAVDFARSKLLPIWIMGGGANTIGRDEGFAGVIILNRLHGIEILAETDQSLQIRGMAGEVWDDVVDFACQKGYSGIEAMSMIPGTLGAAPVQNIGAYGQDISQTIVEVEAYDFKENQFVKLARSEMAMGYRHTRFNYGEDAGRFIITSVTLSLHKGHLQPPFYNSLQNYIIEHGETDYSPQNIRKMVMAIRSEKLPDPKYVASAGSFFKNVYLNQVEADEAEERGIQVWRANDDSGKINAGWLIEKCGLKGAEFNGFRVSEKAALVLINESADSYADLAAARAKIIDAVRQKFGYTLEQEPVELMEAA